MYNPLLEQLDIKKSSIHGNGLFTKEDISKGTVLGVTHVAHDAFPDGWIRTPLGGFYNHSENPNCESIERYLKDLTKVRLLKTLVDIPMYTELTCTYTIWKATPEMVTCKISSDTLDTWLGL
tara:strand:- start:6383 stop:6748 length:366 start_codon:yes stop_codon:yes gene_type:complete